MKQLMLVGLVFMAVAGTSEGRKYGTLQKASHKTFCDVYVIEVAYEGGRVTGSDNSRAYENTQEITVSKEAYDTLQNHLGEKVIFDYKDRAINLCGPSKILTYLTFKK